jgi:hypothetical protein
VGIISDTFVINGGEFPTATSGPTGSFTDFTFTNIPVASVNAATLAAHDTVLLNVASTGMSCDVNNLSAAQKTDLVTFLNGGGKLIIYDSECPAQDYSWLPHPFTTANPGALGGTGTVNIVEDNFLGTDTAGDPHFIDEVLLGQQTDAVGDMNVLTTQDPSICLHMSGTNAANQTGPTHVYYPSGSGLLIYNGFDVDFLGSTTVPDASTPGGNLAKIWLQELQQPRDGSGLACAIAVVGISLAPQQATNAVGASHTVTATVTDQSGAPRPNVLVTFQVTGANAGASGTCNPASCQTDANGQVSFTYLGSTVGPDSITACFTQAGNQVCSAPATKTWTVVTASELSINDVTVLEGNSGTSNAVFTVSLSAASATAVTVDFATADGTAVTPSDYTSASGTLTFAPGETTKMITVLVNGDTLVEPDETFFVNLSNALGATIADGQGMGTIVNDDLPPPVLDHFKCYQTRQVGTKFDPRRVVLSDQFTTERVNVVRPEGFCNPADKDGSGINDPSAHLACYKIGDVRGDEFPKFKKERVDVTDQFGTHSLLLKKIRSLCLPSSKAPLGEVPGSPPPGLDHFKCYKTRQVGTKFDPRQVVLTDQFNTERVNVVRPEAFCNPVDKDGSGINDPSAHLACYKIRDVRGDEFPKFEQRRVEVGDQFGTHTLLLKKTRTLCLPSSKTVL